MEDIGDVIREGGGAFAKGLFRGVTGILTKPLEGAKSSGVEGFVQGFGKGIIGAAAQPVSGVLDLLSKTTEGANAVRMKIASAITSEEQLLRRRLPRVIGGDNLLRPYDAYKATGQVKFFKYKAVSINSSWHAYLFSEIESSKREARVTDTLGTLFLIINHLRRMSISCLENPGKFLLP